MTKTEVFDFLSDWQQAARELESERKEAARLRRHALAREVWHALMLDLCEAPRYDGMGRDA